jgi:trehalose 6-phosphate phosphatase
MRHSALSEAGRRVLARYARGQTLLAFDYDGTLAPITEVPHDALMRASTRKLLRQLSETFPCAVITGRAREDALQLLHDAGCLEVVGNHGIETNHGAPEFAPLVQEWCAALELELEAVQGVWVENKRCSITVHYRRARHAATARSSVWAAVQGLRGARFLGGKAVVNVLPKGAPNKGSALQLCLGRAGCSTAIYVGDDLTDEDAFALSEPVLGIRVGRGRSAASLYVDSQAQVEALMQALLEIKGWRE